MSTPDQPPTTPLTRRRLREIRATGANPVITPADVEAAASAPAPETEAPAAPPAEETPVAAPLPRAAAPAPVAPPPMADGDIDLGMSPLTRRQARAQERIRTASIPVIQSDAVPSAAAGAVAPATQAPAADVPAAEPTPEDGATELESLLEAEQPVETAAEAPAEQDSTDAPADAAVVEAEVVDTADSEPATAESEAEAPVSEDEEPEAREVNPELGSGLLSGDTPPVSIPPSFDQLIARSTSATGSVATPNALILSQTPTAAPLGPITATGEVLITGSLDLPAGFGSLGHAEGAADGKELDAALIDGELPPSSSPTPIAASAAISTARNAGEEIIRPPAPEKGNKLMLALVITAGALAVALVGVLILAVTTGVFS